MIEIHTVVLELGISINHRIAVFLVLLLKSRVFVLAHRLYGPADLQVESTHRTSLLLVSLGQFLLVKEYRIDYIEV